MIYSKALIAAEGMIKVLGNTFTCLEIAGSLRRGVQKDYDEIDLVGIPDLTPPPRPRAEFGKPVPFQYATSLDKAIALLKIGGYIALTQNGPRSKKFFSHLLGIRFDLYIVKPPATWGVIKTLRTGPSEFGHWLVTRKRYGGALPNGFRVQDGAVYEGEDKIPIGKRGPSIGFDTEEGFLDWLGLGWIDPKDRVERWGRGGPTGRP